MDTRIDIIMAVYNEQNALEAAIESIQRQTISNWRIIACDDASTDESYARLCEMAEKDDRIIVLRNEENMGIAATSNRCLAVADAAFIAIHDSDDCSFPERFEVQLNYLREHPDVSFVSSAAILFDESGEYGFIRRKSHPTKNDFAWGNPFVNPCAMFRTEVIRAMNGYREVWYMRRTQDYDLFARLYAAGYEGVNLQTPLLYYRCQRYRAAKRHKYMFRIMEARLRIYIYHMLGYKWMKYIYVLRPLIVGLVPRSLLWHFRAKVPEDHAK